MTSRAHLLALMAQRETLALRKAQAALRGLLARRSDAVNSLTRLQALLGARGADGGLAASLQGDHAMRSAVLAQAEQQRRVIEEIDRDLTEARLALARLDHRVGFLDDAGQTARRAEAEGRQALMDAAMPTLRRR